MANKVVSTIEEHPVISSLILGGAALAITIIIASRNANSNSNSTTQGTQTQSVCTDASGNPVDCATGMPLSGASVSPTLSNTDLASQLSDMEQQILNWEQNIQQQINGINTGGIQSSGNPPSGTVGNPGDKSTVPPPDTPGGLGGGFINHPSTNPPPIDNPPTHKQTLLQKLTGGWGSLFNPQQTAPGSGSYFDVTTAESTNQLAQLFGLQHGWTDIAYNPHNQAMLHQAFLQHGNNVIKAGTEVWIPTTQIPG